MQNEREVMLPQLPDEAANKLLAESPDVANVDGAVIKYEVCDAFTTFSVKWTIRDEADLIITFFPSASFREYVELTESDADLHAAQLESACKSAWNDESFRRSWTELFPKYLNEVAQEHFEATYPRLQAKYTEELKSWWVLAQGYGHILDPERFVYLFLEKMDSRLEM